MPSGSWQMFAAASLSRRLIRKKRINKTKGVTAVKTEVSEFPEAPHVDDSK